MITSAILNIIFALIWVITSPLLLFDDVVLLADLSTSLETSASYINSFSSFLPVTTILLVFSSTIAFELGYFSWKTFNWVRKLLPTQS